MSHLHPPVSLSENHERTSQPLKLQAEPQESAEVQRLKKMIKVLKGGGKADDLDDQVHFTGVPRS